MISALFYKLISYARNLAAYISYWQTVALYKIINIHRLSINNKTAKEDGEEVDDLSDKYKSKLEDVIEKAGELGEELEKSEKEMTDEQKERFVKITKKMFKAINE